MTFVQSVVKQKFPLRVAEAVATHIAIELQPVCTRIEIAGSIRRRKKLVGDIEILYIPRIEMRPDPADLFGKQIPTNLADLVIDDLIRRGNLEKRHNVNGSTMWGEFNKLARAVKTGIPVDLFSATEANWWNYLVCRTGSKETNMSIAAAAQKQGWQWHPTGRGFERRFVSEPGIMRYYVVENERDVFKFAGIDYLEPHQR